MRDDEIERVVGAAGAKALVLPAASAKAASVAGEIFMVDDWVVGSFGCCTIDDTMQCEVNLAVQSARARRKAFCGSTGRR